MFLPLFLLLPSALLCAMLAGIDAGGVGALRCGVEQMIQLLLARGHVAQGKCIQRYTSPATILFARAVVQLTWPFACLPFAALPFCLENRARCQCVAGLSAFHTPRPTGFGVHILVEKILILAEGVVLRASSCNGHGASCPLLKGVVLLHIFGAGGERRLLRPFLRGYTI